MNKQTNHKIPITYLFSHLFGAGSGRAGGRKGGIRGHLAGISSLLPCGSQKPNSGCQAWALTDWLTDRLVDLRQSHVAQASFGQCLLPASLFCLPNLRGHRLQEACTECEAMPFSQSAKCPLDFTGVPVAKTSVPPFKIRHCPAQKMCPFSFHP